MKKLCLAALALSCLSLQAQIAGRFGSGISQKIQTYETATEAMEFWNYSNSAYGITNQPILWMKASAHRWRASDGDIGAFPFDAGSSRISAILNRVELRGGVIIR